MKTNVAEALLKKYGKSNPPQLRAGDTVRIHQKIKEGDKERIQVFEGLVIALKHGNGLDGSFTVRKMAVGGIGVERIYPLHSPNVVKIERVKTAKVSRAKLYYMRYRLGKSARFKVEGRNAGSWDESAAEIVEEPATTEEVEASEDPIVPETEVAAEEIETADTATEATPVAEETEAEVSKDTEDSKTEKPE